MLMKVIVEHPWSFCAVLPTRNAVADSVPGTFAGDAPPDASHLRPLSVSCRSAVAVVSIDQRVLVVLIDFA